MSEAPDSRPVTAPPIFCRRCGLQLVQARRQTYPRYDQMTGERRQDDWILTCPKRKSIPGRIFGFYDHDEYPSNELGEKVGY